MHDHASNGDCWRSQGETTVSLRYEGHKDRTKVEHRHHFERDGVRFWDQWDSKREGIVYSVDGNLVTASGTMINTNRWRQGDNDGWVNVTAPDGLTEQPFTFSVTCN